MINKPIVKSAQKTQAAPLILLPQPVAVPFNPIKKKTKKTGPKAVSFEEVLEYVKTGPKVEDPGNYYEIQDNHFVMLTRMFLASNNKEMAKFLFQKMKVSKFRSYTSAMRTLSNLLDAYFAGEAGQNELVNYMDLIPRHADERFYEEFNDARISLIGGLIIRPEVPVVVSANHYVDVIKNITNCELLHRKDLQNEYDLYESEYCKQLNLHIIDIAETIWPDKAKSLKLLFGSK